MSGVRDDGDALVWAMPAHLHELLLELLAQLDAALDGPTDDPVVSRLFPRAVEDEDDADREFRLLLAGDLLLRRHEAIAECMQLLRDAERGLGGRRRVRLPDATPDMMLAVLNDVRLALGARVGAAAVELRQLVDEDDAATQGVLTTMDMLAWCQMQLLEHIDPAAAYHDDLPDDA